LSDPTNHEPHHPEDALRAYSRGHLSKQAIMDALGFDHYGDVLLELSRHGLSLPSAAPAAGRERHLAALREAIAGGKGRP
jgi:hypothetical protein